MNRDKRDEAALKLSNHVAYCVRGLRSEGDLLLSEVNELEKLYVEARRAFDFCSKGFESEGRICAQHYSAFVYAEDKESFKSMRGEVTQ